MRGFSPFLEETHLLLRVGICLDKNKLEAKGIREKAFRSIEPKARKNKKDKLPQING